MKTVIDLFCGAGGESCGIHSAFERQGEDIRLFAVNHWGVACSTHARNFPKDECICQDIQTVIPTSLVRPDEEVELLWASPECFPAGTLVLTSEGYKPIEEVSIGDLVLTHMNRWRKVVKVMKSKKPTVRLKGYGHPGLETTARHPFYVATRHARDTHRNGVMYTCSKPSFMPVEDIVKAEKDKHVTAYWAKPAMIEELPMPGIAEIKRRSFDVDERMVWLAGRYVADGYARLDGRRGDVTISCGNAKYEETKARLAAWPRAGVRSGAGEMVWHEHKVRTAINFNMSSRAIAGWLISNFGKLAHGKKIPAWLFGAPLNLRQSFLDGYMSGDGNEHNGVLSASTVSKELAYGLSTLLSTMGINAQLYRPATRHRMWIEGREVSCRQQYAVKWRASVDPAHVQTPPFDSGHLWGAIKSIDDTGEEKTVYNLSVEEDESYIAEGICVHNCTHFSTARGGKPMDDQSRCTPFDILRWLSMIRVKRVIIENVREFLTWGPLGPDSRPIPEERGSYFAMFLNSIRGLGYIVDWRVCNAADFGAPTTRHRLFIQCVRKDAGKSIVWPEPRYTEKPEAVNSDLLGTEMKPWVPASAIIDWSIPCQPIDERERPLSANTMRRIMNGIRKYWGKAAEPFLVRYNGGEHRHHSIHEPVPTLDTSNRFGLIQPLIAEMYGTGGCGGTVKPVSNPLPTIAGAGAISIVEPLVMEYYGNGQCQPVSKPLGTVTCKDRFALLNPENCRIGFRMLQPHELAAAQSFPSWYRFEGSKTDVVKQIGNAVCPKMAEALVG